MKYMHGTDKKTHDMFWVWIHRIVAYFEFVVLCGILFLFFLAVYALACGKPVSSADILYILGMSLVVIIIVSALNMFGWRIARYEFFSNGIKIKYIFKTVEIKWHEVKSISIRPVRIIRGPSERDYIIIQLSNYPLLSENLDLDIFFLQRRDYLIIRYTEARLQEFRKYYRKEIAKKN